jgi:general secretion pathway protein N
VLQRPLFAETRRPPPPEAAQDTLGAADGFTLLGTIIAGDGKSALIRYGRPPKLARVGEGQAVEGWTVREILPDRVLLEHGAARRALKLVDHPGAPPIARPPAPRRD